MLDCRELNSLQKGMVLKIILERGQKFCPDFMLSHVTVFF